MVKRLPGLMAVALAGLILAGCETGSASRTTPSPSAAPNDGTNPPKYVQPTNLLAKSRTPVPDLPVPMGFDMVEDISRSYESAGARFIDHSYRGKDDKMEVERFCRIHLPLKSWTMRGSQMVRGTFTMRYEKASEYLEVRIWAEESWTGDKTMLQYNVQTLGRGESEVYKQSYQRLREKYRPSEARQNRD